ncbi:MAG: hypothetical protein IJD78_04970 [Clostridia bacterium]|nr:hypothetical protein [Clostridia bacterium]
MTAKKMLGFFVAVMMLLTALTGCTVTKTNVPDSEETTNIDYDIDIGFAVLKFPTKWKDAVRINQEFDGTIGVVEFYGSIGNHAEQLLFTLCFNQDGEIPVGTLVSDGQNIIISADMNELEFDESWSQEEKDNFCAMQEDINYITGYLENNPDFTAY